MLSFTTSTGTAQIDVGLLLARFSVRPPVVSTTRLPPVEPYETGMLDTGDGNSVYWEVCGNPDGIPAVVLHGGPGQGCSVGMRRALDPDRHRVVLFDQRGCGRSRPHASDPRTDLSRNTTAHLVADIELLREHLGVARWVVFGGSWGTTVALAYAERHPDRVLGMLLVSVTTARRSEIDFLYRGAGRFFPEAWARFSDDRYRLPTDTEPPIEDLLLDYGRRMDSFDPAVRAEAAAAWTAWEDAVISLEVTGRPGTYSGRPDDSAHALVRLCAHYYGNGAFLDDGQLLRDAHRLAGIPGALVHGRADLSCPATTAYELARAWPDARLHLVDDSGHTGSPSMRSTLREAAEELYAAVAERVKDH